MSYRVFASKAQNTDKPATEITVKLQKGDRQVCFLVPIDGSQPV
jgi:hypothetical protein